MEEEENIQNIEEYEENDEENENVEGMNQGENEYEEENMNENDEEEEGQDVFAFDIQINEYSYLLVIGKTDENKLLLRLIDKEDETKPYFQNEFSLEDLRNINPFFNNVDDENIAFHYIIGNLNEADKEIKIIDQEKINFSISINEEESGKIDISFLLFKTINDFEGEEENQNQLIIDNNNNEEHEQIENEADIEEGMEILDNLIADKEGEKQEETDIKKLKQNEENTNNINSKYNAGLSSNLPLQIENGPNNIANKYIEKKEIFKNNINGIETIVEKEENSRMSSKKNNGLPEEKKEINTIRETKMVPDFNKEKILSNTQSIRKSENLIQNNMDEMILFKEEILEKINDLNENFNNQLLKQNESFLQMKKEMKEENENKIKEIQKELNKKDKELNEMKNKFQNINKLENELNENRKIISELEQKINEINKKLDNTNEKLKNINPIINEEVEKNNKKLKSDIDEILKQVNENIHLRKSFENKKNVNNESINDVEYLINNIENIEGQINEIKNEMKSHKNINENNLKIIREKIINLEGKLKENNKGNEIDNKNDEIYNRLNNLEKNINNFNSKFNKIEDNLVDGFNKISNKKKNDEILFNNKLSNFENILNNLESKLLILENNNNNNNNKKPQNNESFKLENKKINELEMYIKNIENRINDYEIEKIIENLSILMEKQNDNENYNKLNNLEIEINEIKININRIITEVKKNIDNKNNIEINNKIKDIENEIKSFETQLKKINDKNQNNNNYKSNLNQRIETLEKNLDDISKKSDDLDIKSVQLFNITKKFEILIKELDKKTNGIIENLNKKIFSKKTNNYNENIRNNETEQNEDVYFKDYNTGKQYQSKNINNSKGIQNETGYQILKENYSEQKNNYEIDSQYNLNQNEKNKSNYLKRQSNHIESKIVKDNEIRFLMKRIREIHPKINNLFFNLIYRATEDGDKASDFHNKCDKIGPNITLVKTKKGYIFGGFTFKNWEHMARDIDINKPNLGSAIRDSHAFGFNVSNQKIYNNQKPNEFAIWCNRNFGPTFKNNLFQIFDSCLRKGGYCSVRNNSHFGGQYYDYEISGGESRFKVEELEVYEIKLH